MAQQVTITFSGMCAFQVNGDSGIAVMPSEGGAHRPVLMFPTDFIDGEATTWKPDLIGDVDFEVAPGKRQSFQVGIWALAGITFRATDAAPAPIPWQDVDKMIDFGAYHAADGIRTLGLSEIQAKDAKGSVFIFKGGTLAWAKMSNVTISRERGSDDNRNVVAKLSWKGSIDVVAKSATEQIVFSGDSAGWASNLAPVSADEGATHVKHYYDLVTVSATADKLTRVADKDTTVFDCIRPIRIP